MTVAFSRGVGGAVDGQAAESYTFVYQGEDLLDAPARESKMKYLPARGGLDLVTVNFASPILSPADKIAIKELVAEARQKIKFTDANGVLQSLDIELGFLDGKMWLFQVRPFVENRKALASDYLNSIAPPPFQNKSIPYQAQL
jgi:hypothetical protein